MLSKEAYVFGTTRIVNIFPKMFISKVTLLLLTAILGYPALIGASDRSGNVAQTSTITNSAAVGDDLIQYIINVNRVRVSNLWRSAGNIADDVSNSAAVRNAFIQYIIHDSSFRNKIAKIVDDVSKGIAGSNYQAGKDPRGTITNSGAVKGRYNQYSVYIKGLSTNYMYGTNPVSHNRRDPTQTGTITNSGAIERDLNQYVINMDDLSIDQIGRRSKMLVLTAALANVAFADPAVGPGVAGYRAIIDEIARASDRRGNVAQTGTITNSAAVGRNLIQYIININEVHIGHLWSSDRDISGGGGRDQTTTKTNSVAVSNTFNQYIIHDYSFRNLFNSASYNQDQTGTITNSGAISRALTQYILNLNDLTIDQIRRA